MTVAAIVPQGRGVKTAIVAAVMAVHLAVLGASAGFLTLKPKPPQDRIVTFVELQQPAPTKPLIPPPAPPPAAPRVQAPLPVITDKATPEQESQAVPAQETAPPPAPPPAPAPAAETEPDYLPQFKIDQAPAMPAKDILERTVYPPLAAKQGIEAVVQLELYIDDTGRIRKINVLKDPGFGFAAAAVSALEGVRTQPALAQGKPVAVKFRYAVRFKLK